MRWFRYKILIVFLLAFVLLTTACPVSESQLDRAAKASRDLSHYTSQTILLVEGLYKSGALSLEVKDRIADQLIRLSRAGKTFNDLISTYDGLYKGGLPASAWNQLIVNFDQVWIPFGVILSLVPQVAGLKDSKAFQVIASSVMAIAKILVTSGVSLKNYRSIEQEVRNLELV